MDEMKLIEDKKNILLCDKILILKKEPLPYCILSYYVLSQTFLFV